MITQIEKAVEEFMAEKLAADVTLTGILLDVRQGTEETTPPDDRSSIIMRGAGVDRTIPNLRDVQMEMVLNSPADVPNVTLASHRLIEIAIEKIWDKDDTPSAAADLSTKIVAELPGWHGGDFFVTGWQPGREDTSFLPIFMVKVGLAKDGV